MIGISIVDLPETLDLSKVGLPSYLTKQLPHSLALGTAGIPGCVLSFSYVNYSDFGYEKQ